VRPGKRGRPAKRLVNEVVIESEREEVEHS
jgi:hypothetical protein